MAAETMVVLPKTDAWDMEYAWDKEYGE